jgi:hypothetical protein
LTFLAQESEGIIDEPEGLMDMDQWLLKFQEILESATGVKIPPDFVKDAASFLVPLVLPPTNLVAHVLLGTTLSETLAGKALGEEAGRHAIATIADVPIDGRALKDLSDHLRRDIVDARRSLFRAQHGLTDEAAVNEDNPREPAKKRSRTADNIKALMGEKTDQVRFALQRHMATQHLPGTIAEAYTMAKGILGEKVEDEDLEQLMGSSVSRWSLARRCPISFSILQLLVTPDHRPYSNSFLQFLFNPQFAHTPPTAHSFLILSRPGAFSSLSSPFSFRELMVCADFFPMDFVPPAQLARPLLVNLCADSSQPAPLS